jgi:hypothetical protein
MPLDSPSNEQLIDVTVNRFLSMDTGFGAFDFFDQTIRQNLVLGVSVLQRLLGDDQLGHRNTKYLLGGFNHLFDLLTPDNQELCDLVKERLVTFCVFLKSQTRTTQQLIDMAPLANGPFDLLVGACLCNVELNKEYDAFAFAELLEVSSDKHLKEMIEVSMVKSVRGYTYEFLKFACSAYVDRLPLKEFKGRFVNAGSSTDESFDHRLDAMTIALSEARSDVPLKKLQRFVDLIWETAKSHGDQEAEQFNRFERYGVNRALFAYKPTLQEAMLSRDLGL